MASYFDAAADFQAADVDALAYLGPIEKSGYSDLCDLLDKRRGYKRSKVLLYLCTRGGDPNAGYRIARALSHEYGVENFRVAVPSDCKSAGTLICVGARSLVFFDRGELGPLDVQFQKGDEIFQQSSGLDILRGMTYLKDDALAAFNQYLLDINGGSGLSTKVASEIAGNLVKGIYEPMYAQIDPIRLGEMNAALQIAHEYGTRLNNKAESLKSGALRRLIHEYPTHGFVIDRAEARELFQRVDLPSEPEAGIGELADLFWSNNRRSSSPRVVDLCNFVESLKSVGKKDQSNEPDTGDGHGVEGGAAPAGQAPAVAGEAGESPAA
jgi:hypothetical protein